MLNFKYLLPFVVVGLISLQSNALALTDTAKQILGSPKVQLSYPKVTTTTVKKIVKEPVTIMKEVEKEVTEKTESQVTTSVSDACAKIGDLRNKFKNVTQQTAIEKGLQNVIRPFLAMIFRNIEDVALTLLVAKQNGATASNPFNYNEKCPAAFLFNYYSPTLKKNVPVTIYGLFFSTLEGLEKEFVAADKAGELQQGDPMATTYFGFKDRLEAIKRTNNL